jgi:hypothetical protein
MRKLDIDTMKVLARERGGRCISTLYVNSTHPLLWQCASGHQWSAVPASIRKGTWCPDCAGVRRPTLEQMNEIARSRGRKCLSDRYRNSATKLEWRCSKGHEWSATALQVKKGHWCPFCAQVAHLNLQILQRIAALKGGYCLSLTYVNSSHPVGWKCADGHEWVTRASSVRAGNWCPACVHNQRLRLEEMREIARERGGMCLSTNYKNGSTALLWVCKFGHHWKAAAASVKGGSRRKGSWCRECYNWRRRFQEKDSIEAMRELAISRGGVCLSTEYLGSKVGLEWACQLGQRWQASPSYVVQGTWCPTCARNQRFSLRFMHNLAAHRLGTCLSDVYINERTGLRWRCIEGHEWEAKPAKIRRGSWCPTCAHIARRSKWILKRDVGQSQVYKAAIPVKGHGFDFGKTDRRLQRRPPAGEAEVTLLRLNKSANRTHRS